MTASEGMPFDEDAFNSALGNVDWDAALTVDDLFGDASSPAIGMVLTSIGSAGVVAAALRLLVKQGGADEQYILPEGAFVIPTDSGAVIAAHTQAKGADAMGSLASGALKGIPLVVLHHANGQMSAKRWRNGSVTDEVAPGLILASCDDLVEEIILGEIHPKDAPYAVEIAKLSKVAALKMLAMGKRGAPKSSRKDQADD